jgi:16S rRNA (guanine966-N2)-methyltransferase
VTRIIAGVAGGRRLVVPGSGTRPTSDRAREGLFSAVLAMLGTLEGAAVLDLYAGSGAVGLEALSRGASEAVLIEADPGAVQVIRRNIESVGLPSATLVKDRVARALRRGPPGTSRPRDLVFADPPYSVGDDELREVLDVLATRGWLAPGALVVIERDARSGPPPWPAAYAQGRSRRYGETVLWYGRAAGPAPACSEEAAPTGA